MKNEEAITCIKMMFAFWANTHKLNVAQMEAAKDLAIAALGNGGFIETSKMVPLTLEQLRGMVGQPVWIENIAVPKNSGWAVVEFGDVDNVIGFTDDRYKRVSNYGKAWLAYAYPPAHIDREEWGECAYCGGIPHMEGVDLKPCASGNIGCEVTFGKCREDETVGMVVYHRNAAAGYVDFDFCPFCGKPQNEKAWAELEKRLRG